MTRDPKKELKAFILRYHGQQAITGLVMFITLGVSIWLVFAVIGFFSLHDRALRTALFFIYLVVFVALSIKYWIPGVLALVGWRNRLSEKEAARILKRWMPGIDDKYVNLIELEESDYRLISPGLWKWGVEKKAAEVSGFPLEIASPWKDVRPALKWLMLPVVLVLFFIVLGKWNWVQEGSTAVWSYQREILPRDPFEFVLNEKVFLVERGGSVRIELATRGEIEPDMIHSDFNGIQQKLRKEGQSWTLMLPNVMSSGKVYFEGGGLRSKPIEVLVVDVSRLENVKLLLRYPKYLGRETEEREWSNRVVVPRGTEILVEADKVAVNEWRASYRNRGLALLENGFSLLAIEGGKVDIELLNGLNKWVSWGGLDVEVVLDERPTIDVSYEGGDSLVRADLLASDDFGIRSLTWVLFEKSTELWRKELSGPQAGSISMSHKVNKDWLLRNFPTADSWAYSVLDNDAPAGYKSSISERYRLERVSEEEKLEALRNQTANMSSGANNSQKELMEQKKLLEQLAAESRGSKMNFGERNKVETQVEKLRKNQEARQKRLQGLEESLKDLKTDSKAEDKEEILNRIEEAKEKSAGVDLEKLQELLNKEKKEELLKLLQESQKKEKEAVFTEKQLAELLKRLDVELQFEQSLEQLEGLKDKQMELANREDLDESEQEKLNAEIENWNKEYEELLESNKGLKEDFDIESLEKERSEVLKEASEAAAASKSGDSEMEQKEQKESAEKLEEMLSALSAMSESMNNDSHEENMETLRQIQDNLILYSQREEAIGTKLNQMDPKDPSITVLMQEQQELQQGAVVIEDSLRALAMRVPMIGKTIFGALARMNMGASSAKLALAEREVAKGQAETRYSMMAANELALLLDEVSKKMQAQLKGMKAGKSSCNKPGGAKPSPSGMKAEQKKLMKEMGDKLGKGKKGEKKGEKGKDGKKGEKGKEGEGLSGKEFSDLLQKQEALRQMLQEMIKEDGSLGLGGSGEELMELMEESEKELAEMVLNAASLERQREIESRLLEAEEALRERGEEERRESKGSERKMEFIGEWGSKDADSQNEIERIKQDPIRYKSFYKERIIKVPSR